MTGNFLIMLFCSIGVIGCIKKLAKTFMEIRMYWKAKEWKNKIECIDGYIILKSQGMDVIDVVEDYTISPYYSEDDFDDEYMDESKEIDMLEETFNIPDNTDKCVEVELYMFRKKKRAEACKKLLGKDCLSVYNIEKKFYLMAIDGANERYIKNFGGKMLGKDERERIFNMIIKENSMVFEFKETQMAAFFIERFELPNAISMDGHLFVDMSNFSENEAQYVRQIASECFGEEVTDSFLVEQIKTINSSVN